MNVEGKQYRTVWAERARGGVLLVRMIDQRALPHRFSIATMKTHRDTARAIAEMTVRGAPAIGVSGAYGLAQAAFEAPAGEGRSRYIEAAYELLRSTRPTAQDLFYMLDRVKDAIGEAAAGDEPESALNEAERLAEENADRCRRIGEHGKSLIEPGSHVLTHCNAGWLAAVDWGTALAPIYMAHRSGVKFSVFADETRPRLQGSNLTAWELGQEGIDYEIIADNAAGLLMSRSEVQLVITGADRVAANGDVANKIGTYEKALIAREHAVPFYVAAPASTFDLSCATGAEIPIEERDPDEVLYASGQSEKGDIVRVRLAPEGARARNPAFDVTPAALIAGLVTEHGIIAPNREAIARALGVESRRPA